jgi:hypothetical protein
MEDRQVSKQVAWYMPNERRDAGKPCRRWNSLMPEQAIGLILDLYKNTDRNNNYYTT